MARARSRHVTGSEITTKSWFGSHSEMVVEELEDGKVVLIDDDTFLFKFDLLFSKFSYPNPSARIKFIVSAVSIFEFKRFELVF